ncbi:AroM family protein [uncultured Jannaschia sp.]|uniref:AroM family protein n=1 Tax=uncultured Jannaschia sp. TaxID=293347 RepID=UPI00262D718F|nr:AroM family protein [uncultured Jannaschia sp.]
MSAPLIGLLVIGQSPRPDLEAEFARVKGKATLRTLGALDGLDAAALAAVAPENDADTLYTTLPSGRSVLISKKAVTQGLETRLADLDGLGAAVTVLCCTGRFPSLEAPGVHFASDLLAGAVAAALPQGGRLGVFIPDQAQAAHAGTRWRENGFNPVVVPLRPDAPDDAVVSAAERMKEIAPDLVVHDCISYGFHARSLASGIHGRPALLASSVAARLAAELCGA